MAGKPRHGMSKSPVYKAWAGMIQRCENPKNNNFKNYGARGISVCDRWKNFEDFIADMGPRPEGFSIERDDSSKDYEPGNCRWASRADQNKHYRRFSNNSSGANGVWWHKKSAKWTAMISVQGKPKYLGLFDRIEDAISARKLAERELGYHPQHGAVI